MLSRLYPIFWIPGLDYFWGKVLAVFCVVQILLIITLRWTRLSMGMDYLNPLLIVCLLIESGIASSDLSFGITVMRNEYLVRGPNWLTFSWGIYFLLAMVLVHFIAAWMLPDIAAQEDMNREVAIRRRKRRRKSKRSRIASAEIEEETE
ncbi:MAG: hypothetical protein KDA80_23955 [Planctomycetaceae bacterium]|nr:hypothetical protein [Planctomycetaceae bacterium]